MAAPIQYPKIFVNHPEQHVIRNHGLQLDARKGVLTIIGLPILYECLWPHLVYRTYWDRWLEHGEILRLRILPPDDRHQWIDLVGIVDIWGNYERITDLTGSRWVCQRADDFSHVPKMNLVAECPCKILFKDRNVDKFRANDYLLSEPSDLPFWRSDASMPAIRSPAMTWPQQCGVGGSGD